MGFRYNFVFNKTFAWKTLPRKQKCAYVKSSSDTGCQPHRTSLGTWEKKKIPNYDIRKKELRGIKSASTWMGPSSVTEKLELKGQKNINS